MGAMERDAIIRGGMIVDGSGNPWYRGDVAIRNGRIVSIGDLSGAEASTVIDAAGRVVSPGFIDIHNHSDIAVLARPSCDSHLLQGITTMVVGQCGSSAAPALEPGAPGSEELGVEDAAIQRLREEGFSWGTFAEYLAQVERRNVATNVAAMVGHGTVRAAVLGWANRAPDESELRRMRAYTAEAMEAGAFGLTSGLMYAPGFFAGTEEVLALNKVAGEHGGFYATHIRDETSAGKYRGSVEEAIRIGCEGGTPVQISHLETHYPNWGMQAEVLRHLEDARTQGIDVSCDVPPYLLGTTGLSSALPDWALEGGLSDTTARLRDPAMRRKIAEDRESKRGGNGMLLLGGHWDKLWIEESRAHPDYTGRSLAEIAAARGVSPTWDLVFDLLLEEGSDLGVNCQWHDADDIRVLVAHPLCMIETDASVVLSETGRPNPRAYGAFPATFRKYVRGETRSEEPREPGARVLTLQEAVRKMTSFPAQRLGLRDRGLVREGIWADLLVFDPERIADRTTYASPHQYPTGIDYVIVNGQVAAERGQVTTRRAGQVLRHTR